MHYVSPPLSLGRMRLPRCETRIEGLRNARLARLFLCTFSGAYWCAADQHDNVASPPPPTADGGADNPAFFAAGRARADHHRAQGALLAAEAIHQVRRGQSVLKGPVVKQCPLANRILGHV